MPETIWTATLDGRFVCTVNRTGERTGILTVVDQTTNESVLSRDVGLSYGAIFGPDVADVQDWQDAIFKELAAKGLVQ